MFFPRLQIFRDVCDRMYSLKIPYNGVDKDVYYKCGFFLFMCFLSSIQLWRLLGKILHQIFHNPAANT